MPLFSSIRFLDLCILLSFVNVAFHVSSAYVADQNSDTPPDSDQLQPTSDIKEEPLKQMSRQTKEDQGTVAGRFRRSSEKANRVSGGQWSTIGRVDQEEDPHSKRNFMRFGRSEGERDDGDICVPLLSGEGQEDEMTDGRERTSGKVGVDDGWFQRSFRDQSTHDYSGKPFMRFGKRFMRFGRAGRQTEFVCFRQEEGRDNLGVGKRFMRFGRRVFTGRSGDPDLFTMNDLKRFMRFGRSLPSDTADESDQVKV